MKDGHFDFKRVRRRLRSPLRTGAGTVDAVDRVLLRTQAGEDVGFGEIAPWPGFPTESVETAVELLRSAQGNLSHLLAVTEAAPATLPCLRAALASCRHWREIAGFGGALPCAGLIALEEGDPDPKIAAGFRTLKLKISPATQVESVQALLRRFDGTLRLDANGSLDLAAARAWAYFVRAEPRIEFLEQPLPVGNHGYASLGTDKIALDESFLTPAGFEWDGPVVVKPLLAGDWDELRAWRQSRSAPTIYSSSFETAIGRQGALWLAAQDPRAGTVGFDTLGRFENDARDRHAGGPSASGLAGFDWEAFWRELT